MSKGIWKSDWFAGLLITIAFLFFSNSTFIQSIEQDAYDFGVRSSYSTASEKVAVIAIDDESIANIGRWPWSRNIHAELHSILADGGAKVVGQTVIFSEPQLDAGTQFIKELKASFEQSSLAAIPELITELNTVISNSRSSVTSADGKAAINSITDYMKVSPFNGGIEDEINGFIQYISDAGDMLESDVELAESMAISGNVVLAMNFQTGNPIGQPDTSQPEFIIRNVIPQENINESITGDYYATPITMVEAYPPITILGKQSSGIGSLVLLQDIDGGIRSEPLVVDYYGDLYPSMALMLAAKSLNLGVDAIKVNKGDSVQLGQLTIKTDSSSLMNTFFYNTDTDRSIFPVDSFYDVLQGKIPASKYKNKVVLIGSTALGIGDTMVTPINSNMSPVLTLAHSVSSILQEDFFIEPEWSAYVTYAAALLIALYLMFLLPALNAAIGFLFTTILLIILVTAHYILMTNQGMWIHLMMPTLLLVIGHILLTTKRFLMTEKGKERLDFESAESNRMLGLSMQGQGQLDVAFDKFRKLPLEKATMDLLYSLAMDFERARQFNKAKAVYDYMSDFDPKFRDIEKRAKTAMDLNNNAMVGGETSVGGNVIAEDGSVAKPQLGRYEIDREIGKGAMGAVFLGHDTKITRTVAIKTMALAQEFEDDELAEVKERFFREAESAGRLNHPNIVTIYDVGEENDLAYIAMEYITGADLANYIKPGKLLPVNKVIQLMMQCADGMSYAHSFNIVHRDIKPANIMWDPETDVLKITDFGVARITDSSKTKTGMVLGTPSYMSPEQLSGEKIMGQSDVFSLGVMFFQLLTGRLPFKGDSMANLMYLIANEPHPDPLLFNPDIPPCALEALNRAMEKDRAARYQTAGEMAEDLKACLKFLNVPFGKNKDSDNTKSKDSLESSNDNVIKLDPDEDVDFPI